MEILYFTFHLKFVNSQMAAMSKCPDYVKREIEYYLHDKLPNESIISMLSNAKMHFFHVARDYLGMRRKCAQ